MKLDTVRTEDIALAPALAAIAAGATHIKILKDGGKRASYEGIKEIIDAHGNDDHFMMQSAPSTVSFVQKSGKEWVEVDVPTPKTKRVGPAPHTLSKKASKPKTPAKKHVDGIIAEGPDGEPLKPTAITGKTGFMAAVDELFTGEYTTRQIGEKLATEWGRELQPTKAVVRARMKTLIKRGALDGGIIPLETEETRKITFLG